MKKQGPLLRLWELGEQEHGGLIRAVLYALALSMSHKATFAILKGIRERILNKLPRLPLGTIDGDVA